ncbi:MAG: FAD:protein FMN transferase [Solirubrobacterales bacterium]
MTEPEARESFECFGGEAAVIVGGGPDAAGAAGQARERMLSSHQALSRFIPGSELSRLNSDPRETVPASPLLRRFAAAAREAGARSGGLVDATLLTPIEEAGYRKSIAPEAAPIPLREALAAAPPRRPASPRPGRQWNRVEIDEDAGTITRPPGTGLDSGGIAKGLVADLIAAGLRTRPAYVVDCCGDLRIGGAARAPRSVRVEGPFGEGVIEELPIAEGAVATSGIGRRAWRRAGGGIAHHLLDPSTGQPAFTGLVQVTAVAPTARLAEVLAKTALLAGPSRAAFELPFGGVLVADDGSVETVSARVGIDVAVGQPAG